MANWRDVEAAEPEFADRVRALFDAHKHKTMATLRKDGSPRISGTEVEFRDGDIWIGSMLGAMKARDLQRDPRMALHSASVDPTETDPGAWPGDAKLSGRAMEIYDPDQFVKTRNVPEQQYHLFKIDIDEVVLTRVGDPPDHLVIELWTPARGLVRTERKS